MESLCTCKAANWKNAPQRALAFLPTCRAEGSGRLADGQDVGGKAGRRIYCSTGAEPSVDFAWGEKDLQRIEREQKYIRKYRESRWVRKVPFKERMKTGVTASSWRSEMETPSRYRHHQGIHSELTLSSTGHMAHKSLKRARTPYLCLEFQTPYLRIFSPWSRKRALAKVLKF